MPGAHGMGWDAPATATLETILNGRWLLEPAPLAGADPAGCSVLYRAVDRDTPGRVVVAKLERPEEDRAAQSRARLRREHAILSRIRDPHVVVALDGGVARETGGRYLILEYHQAGSLARLLRATTGFELAWALEATAETLRALVSLHERLPHVIVHRDVNPRNLLVVDDLADRPRLVLADFGLAHDLGAPEPPDDRITVGPVYSPYYAPPELVRGDPPEQAGVATDLYQASALLYELVTGLPPYHWEVRAQGARFEALVLGSGTRPLPASACNPALPAALDDLLAAGLAQRSGERPGSARELLEPLAALARSHGRLPIPFAALRGRGLAASVDLTA